VVGGVVLIIPDIHENMTALQLALQLRQPNERVTILGDWFDTFGTHHVNEMCEVITTLAADPDCTLLLGNHDCHYAFDHNGFVCSGYRPVTKVIVGALIPRTVWERFQIFTWVGPYLVSHAGFHEGNLHLASQHGQDGAIQRALDGLFDDVWWGVGRSRGGWLEKGGPTWLDWNSEFSHIEDVPQIVGHTVGKDIRMKGSSYCIDNQLRHCVRVNEDTGAVDPLEVA
jgi:hypothetical protein